MADDQTASDKFEDSLKEGETIVRGTISRVISMGPDAEPIVFFVPTSEIRHLELEGHRIATGELVVTHDKHGVPKQFDPKRIAVSGDLKVGSEITLVHLDRVRR